MKLIERILTERLVIRPFEMRDWAPYLAFMTDPTATRYLMFTDEQRTEAGARELFEMIVGSYGTAEPIMAYAIARREDGRFVGSCGVSPLDEPGVYECYYSLLPRYWKRGYATESTRALLARCLAEEGVREIRAYMSPENVASAGVAERVGMAYRGVEVHPLFGNEGQVYVLTRE